MLVWTCSACPPDSTGEPSTLSQKPIADTFGVGTPGDPVKWNHPGQKVFDFAFTSPVPAVVILHYQARDISAGEVLISVNGADVGQVPADTMAVNERSNEVLVPGSVLKKGEPNKVVFHHTRNPPGDEPWRIWNTWVEVALLPELPADQLRLEANNKLKQGQEMFERRDVGASNRWEANKPFREAWLMNEARRKLELDGGTGIRPDH